MAQRSARPIPRKAIQSKAIQSKAGQSKAGQAKLILLQPQQILYDSALAYHRSGRLASAERCYRQILEMNPRHADSLHLLGVIGHQAGQHQASADLIARAIAVNGLDASYHCNLGSALQALGRSSDAELSYRNALALKSDHPEAHNNLGNLLQSLGRVSEAVVHYHYSLAAKPDDAQTHNNLGNAKQALGRPQEAVDCYGRALALRPEYEEAHNNLGNVLHALGRLGDAEAHYGRALTLNPGYAEAHNNLGNLLSHTGRKIDALASYRRALALRPSYAEAHNNLGNLLCEEGRLDEAEAHCRLAVTHRPGYAAGFNNLGIAFQAAGRFGDAVECYEKAISLQPNYAEAHLNWGNALQAQGNHEDAQSRYARALELRPDYAEAHMNRALGQLQVGKFELGWQGHEWRWRLKGFDSPRLIVSQPQWCGEPLNGARILLHSEQGLGDCLQFLRYLPMVLEAGGTVLLEVPKALRRIAALMPGVTEVIDSGDPRPYFDLHCPLMSLPLAFGTTLETIPAVVPYLSLPAEAVRMAGAQSWQSDGLRVGLVWAGNPKHRKDRLRSIPFSVLEPLLGIENVHFFSLQVGIAIPLTASSPMVIDLSPSIGDMADTAALMTQLDLVISVDTSVAHLAGALGKPVWLMLPHDSDWRWLLNRDDSPWYPTARLFRQASPGDWGGVVARVVSAMGDALGFRDWRSSEG